MPITMRLPVTGILAACALAFLAFSGPASAQQVQKDAIHLPNGTRYINCFAHGCYDGVILDHPNGEVCEGIGLYEFQRQRFFCHK